VFDEDLRVSEMKQCGMAIPKRSAVNEYMTYSQMEIGPSKASTWMNLNFTNSVSYLCKSSFIFIQQLDDENVDKCV